MQRTTRPGVGLFLPAPEQHAPDEQEDHGADEGDDDLAEYPVADREVHQAGQPASEDRAKDPDDQVPEPAPASAHDDQAGQEPGDQSDEDEYGDALDSHCAI